MSNVELNTLEGVFRCMVNTHNERTYELRMMYRLLAEQGCELPLNFQAPEATFDEDEGLNKDGASDRPFFGLVRKPESETEQRVAEVQNGPIRGSVQEVLPSGLVVTTSALTDNGKVVVGDRRHAERPAVNPRNADAQDVEVREQSSLAQLRRVAQESDAPGPEPTIPSDFSLAAATKVTVTPITNASLFFAGLNQIFLDNLSPQVHSEAEGTWSPMAMYDENPLSAPTDILINWPTGLYRNGDSNIILINISKNNEAVYLFEQSYHSSQDQSKSQAKVLLRQGDGTIAVLDNKSSPDLISEYRTTAIGVLEAFFSMEKMAANLHKVAAHTKSA